MKREMFVRIATASLRQNQGRSPQEQAEAIAQLMDTVNAVLEDDSSNPSPYQPADPAPAFPAPPSAAVHEISAQDTDRQPAMLQQSPQPTTPLIITDTRMPASNERARIAAPPAQIEKPGAGGMKVEDLSRLVQERTPMRLPLEFATEDGYTRRAVWERNVISRHAFESVQLIYAPLNASPSVREISEVSAVISIHDLPVDLTAIVAKLRTGAINSIAPRGPVVSSTPPVGVQHPIQHPADTYKTPGQTKLTENTVDVFNALT